MPIDRRNATLPVLCDPSFSGVNSLLLGEIPQYLKFWEGAPPSMTPTHSAFIDTRIIYLFFITYHTTTRSFVSSFVLSLLAILCCVAQTMSPMKLTPHRQGDAVADHVVDRRSRLGYPETHSSRT
jgi:hypothetical protein